MRRWITIFIITILILFALFIGHSIKNNNFTKTTSFTQETWNQSPHLRINIVDDLQSKYNLYTMNRREIIELLGDKECTEGDGFLIYTLGQTNGLFHFSKYLSIEFNQDEEVTQVRIYED